MCVIVVNGTPFDDSPGPSTFATGQDPGITDLLEIVCVRFRWKFYLFLFCYVQHI